MGATVQLIARAVTGRVRYYPTGELAETIKQLIKKKTLSELEVEALKRLGCRVEILKDGSAPAVDDH